LFISLELLGLSKIKVQDIDMTKITIKVMIKYLIVSTAFSYYLILLKYNVYSPTAPDYWKITL